MQYEYSNEPEDGDEEDEDSATAERNYVNELILQRSRNRHPAFSDDHDQQDSRTTSTTPTSSMQTSSMGVLVHGQVTIIFVVSVCLFVCLSVCLCRVFFQPSSIRFGSN